jgi:hypothetical protein
VRVSLKEYQGHTYLDVRIYTEIEGRPEKTRTKRGITLKLALIPEVIEALRQAEAAAREAGL